MEQTQSWKLVIILGLLMLAGCAQTATKPNVKIGILLPLSGDLAITGEKLHRGVMLAEKELPPGTTLVYEDSGSTTTSALDAAQKLIAIDKVDAIIGAYSPDQALAVAPVAEEAGITIFSPSFCSDSFKSHRNIYCGYPGAKAQLDTIDEMFERKQIKRVALVDQNSDFGQNSRAAMIDKAASLGYTVVFDESVQGEEKDFRTVVTKLMATHADAFPAQWDPKLGIHVT